MKGARAVTAATVVRSSIMMVVDGVSEPQAPSAVMKLRVRIIRAGSETGVAAGGDDVDERGRRRTSVEVRERELTEAVRAYGAGEERCRGSTVGGGRDGIELDGGSADRLLAADHLAIKTMGLVVVGWMLSIGMS